MQMGKVGLSIDGAGGFQDSIPKPTHHKLRKIFDNHSQKVTYKTSEEDQGNLTMKLDGTHTSFAHIESGSGIRYRQQNASFAMPPHPSISMSRDEPLNRSAFPYIHGKIAEEFYPIDRNNNNKILPADL